VGRKAQRKKIEKECGTSKKYKNEWNRSIAWKQNKLRVLVRNSKRREKGVGHVDDLIVYCLFFWGNLKAKAIRK
jgi:hypothetical protein